MAEAAIRDAACLLVVDLSQAEPKLLMGRRHADQVFLPDKWVFPGGRVEDEDRRFADLFSGVFSPRDLANEIRPFALAGIRELYEETGLLIGSDEPFDSTTPVWKMFAASGQTPAPVHLFPLARAITPPGRVRRYDTWFFMASADALSANHATTDGELLDLDWFTFSEAANLDLPNITRLILNDVTAVLANARAIHDSSETLPFYYYDNSSFRRELISCKVAPSPP
ncbi:MAG: NUDIX hydrolase [Proteobacteria bacterium]|nr:NUDIX hydrolase [Pseudomonadota bacterium]